MTGDHTAHQQPAARGPRERARHERARGEATQEIEKLGSFTMSATRRYYFYELIPVTTVFVANFIVWALRKTGQAGVTTRASCDNHNEQVKGSEVNVNGFYLKLLNYC